MELERRVGTFSGEAYPDDWLAASYILTRLGIQLTFDTDQGTLPSSHVDIPVVSSPPPSETLTRANEPKPLKVGGLGYLFLQAVSESPEMPGHEIASLLKTAPETASRTGKRLKERGYVTSHKSSLDARVTLWSATPLGLGQLAADSE